MNHIPLSLSLTRDPSEHVALHNKLHRHYNGARVVKYKIYVLSAGSSVTGCIVDDPTRLTLMK